MLLYTCCHGKPARIKTLICIFIKNNIICGILQTVSVDMEIWTYINECPGFVMGIGLTV